MQKTPTTSICTQGCHRRYRQIKNMHKHISRHYKKENFECLSLQISNSDGSSLFMSGSVCAYLLRKISFVKYSC